MRKKEIIKNVINNRRVVFKPDYRDVGAILLFILLVPYIISFLFGNVERGKEALGEGEHTGADAGLFQEDRKTAEYVVYNKTAAGTEMIPLETYLAGRLPATVNMEYEMEALKAQAVAARTYAARNMRGSDHSPSYHFDICTTTHCQVYHGVGRANSVTDQAVEETAGQMAYYNGQLIDAVYSSSHGGASEDAKNVWGIDHPYLKGVIDPYEADVADIAGNYKWTKTYTPATLKARLQEKGIVLNGDLVNFTTKKSETGNVISFTVTDSSGKNYTVSRSRVREYLAVNSIRFDLILSGGTAGTPGYTIAERPGTVGDLTTQYAISGDGTVTAIPNGAYAITGDGIAKLEPSPGAPTGTGENAVYTLDGKGWGHSVGMSQWGAYAMAKRGMSYLDILHFYYTDITVE